MPCLSCSNDGALHVSMDMDMKEGSKAPQLPRFGVLMQLPYNMDSRYSTGVDLSRTMLIVSFLSASAYMSRLLTSSSSLTFVHRKQARRATFAGGSRLTTAVVDSEYCLMRLHSLPAHCTITFPTLMREVRSISVTVIRFHCLSTLTSRWMPQ